MNFYKLCRIVPLTILVLISITDDASAGIKRLNTGCKTSALDLIFLIDSSSDVNSLSLRRYKNFVKRIINSYDVSAATVRPSVIMYGDDVKQLNDLKAVGDDILNTLVGSSEIKILGKNGITELVLSASPVGGRRRVGHALSYVCDDVLQMKNNEVGLIAPRRQVPAVIIVISSGTSTDNIPKNLSCFNPSAFSDQRDVTIIGIAVGAGAERSLRSKHVTHLNVMDTSTRLLVVDDQVAKNICKAAVHDCPNAYHDMVFLIDGSNHVTSDQFNFIKEWASRVTNSFQIGPNKTRVGLVQFADNPQTEFELDTFTDNENVSFAIANIKQMGGRSNPTRALQYAVLHAFTEIYGSRDDQPQVLIYLTTDADQGEDLSSIVEEIRFSGIIVDVVGVGRKINTDELKSIASSPASNHLIMVPNFEKLLSTNSKIVHGICKAVHSTRPSSVIDMQFLIHGSGTVSDDGKELDSSFEIAFLQRLLKLWIKKIADGFFIGKHYARVAVTTFGNNVTHKFGFKDFLSKDDLLERINELKNMYGNENANIGSALNATYQEMVEQSRPDSIQMVVLVTDAASDDDVTGISNFYRQSDIPVFAVGYGDGVDISELNKIATSPDYAIHADNINDLTKTTSQLISLMSEATQAACDDIELDIEYLLDGSTSINPGNFAKVKEWVKSLTSTFDIGEYTNRVGLNQYSNDTLIEFSLNQYFNKPSVLAAIDNVDYKRGRTRIGAAINFTRKYSLIEKAGARPLVKKILLVMTDGVSDDLIGAAADVIHDMKLVSTYAVGVGEVSIPQLKKIASDPDSRYMYKVDDFDAINSIRTSLIKKICEDGKKDRQIACPNTEMDAVFLMDAYIGRREKTFLNTKKFLTKLVENFKIGATGSLFGLVQYDDTTRLEFGLNEYTSSQSLKNGIMNIQLMDSTGRRRSLLGSALQEVRQLLTQNNNFGARPNVQKVIFVVTGSSSEDELNNIAAELMHDDIQVFAISGGTRVNNKQIKQITTFPPPRHFFPIHRFHQMSKLERSLTKSICEVLETECKYHAVDLVFLLECSTNENLKTVKSFMLDIIKKFNVSSTGMMVGLHRFWDLKNTTSLENLRNNINSINECYKGSFNSASIRYLTEEGFSKGSGKRKNVPSVAVIITDKLIEDSEEATTAAQKAHEAGIKIVMVNIGGARSPENTNLTSSPNSDYSFEVEDYSHLNELVPRITRRICIDARCPIIERNGKFIQGANLLEKFGILNDTAVGVKRERGIKKNDIAYKVIAKKAHLSVAKREIAPARCLYYFTLVTLINMKKLTSSRSNWDILKITDGDGKPEVTVSCRGRSKDFVLVRKGGDDLVINNNISRKFFDKEWHQLEVHFGRNEVIMYLDCQRVGAYPIVVPLRNVINDTGNVVCGSYFRTGANPVFSLQDMTLKCHNGDVTDVNRNEMCCGLKSFKKDRRCRRSVPEKPPKSAITTTTPSTTTTTTTPPTTTTTTTTTPSTTTTTTTTVSTAALTTTTERFLPADGKPSDIVGFTTKAPCQCEAGLPGPPGAPGPPGVNGEPGVPGERGEKGYSGSMGIPGFPGAKGEKGNIGPIGPPGPSQIVGSTNVTYIPGPKGEKGEVGRNGINGVQKGRNRGVSEMRVRQISREILAELLSTELPRMIEKHMNERYGSNLYIERGPPGPQGPRGYPGDAGPMGRTGPPGDRGPEGAQGVPGIRGLPGKDGVNGEKGSKGIGLPGPSGPPGPRGPQGVSIHGQPGNRGPPGSTGQRGSPGPRGYPGLQGRQGYCDNQYCYQTVRDLLQHNGNPGGEEYSELRYDIKG